MLSIREKQCFPKAGSSWWEMNGEHRNERPFNITEFHKHLVKHPRDALVQVISETPKFFYTFLVQKQC